MNYQKCGYDKGSADDLLYEDIRKECEISYPEACPEAGDYLYCKDYDLERKACFSAARIYKFGVKTPPAMTAWLESQNKFCKCCVSE